MFCLRSWLPLLFIPTNASPTFIFLFFVCTYFLNRPCVYCSFLLLILFLTSCNWSDRCFFDFGSNWFEPRASGGVGSVGLGAGAGAAAAGAAHSCPSCEGSRTASSSQSHNGTALPIPDLGLGLGVDNTTLALAADLLNTTAKTLAGSAAEELARTRAEWTGIGMEWLRSLLGRREWRIDCLDVYVRL